MYFPNKSDILSGITDLLAIASEIPKVPIYFYAYLYYPWMYVICISDYLLPCMVFQESADKFS